MGGQLNISAFGISQNPRITRFCAVIIYENMDTTGIYISSKHNDTAKYSCIK